MLGSIEGAIGFEECSGITLQTRDGVSKYSYGGVFHGRFGKFGEGSGMPVCSRFKYLSEVSQTILGVA